MRRATILVRYQGLLPDLFREGQGVVTEGVLEASGVFRADTVLAKHDETYMPREVADALRRQGHWQGEGKACTTGAASEVSGAVPSCWSRPDISRSRWRSDCR